MNGKAFTRRALLGGAGVALTLPLLESLLPRSVARAGGMAIPRRMLVYYVPNGINGTGPNSWRPTSTGRDFALTPMLEPLGADLKPHVLLLTGLSNRPAQANYNGTNDGTGDHARGTGSFLTCARLRKTDGTDIQNGVSADQVAAEAFATATRYPSLQLGIDGGSSAGGCDSGYSCAYSRNISWSGPSTPLPKLTNPRTVFDRLFAGFDPNATREAVERRRAYQTSVLDYVHRDAQRLSMRLGATDRRKLDEYMTSVREVEQRVARATAVRTCEPIARPPEGLAFAEHVAVMTDLMALAFRCDLTRVITFMLGNAGSGRNYDFIGASGAHHELSHHQRDPEKFRKLQIIGTWEVAQFALLLRKLAEIPEADGGSVLDHSTVLFSSEISDGNGHHHYDLPVLLAGRCGGQFDTGRHVVYDPERSIANLYIAMLRAVGVGVTGFGLEGTGPLANLGPVSG